MQPGAQQIVRGTVQVFNAPGGTGQVIVEALPAATPVTIGGCRDDDWCAIITPIHGWIFSGPTYDSLHRYPAHIPQAP